MTKRGRGDDEEGFRHVRVGEHPLEGCTRIPAFAGMTRKEREDDSGRGGDDDGGYLFASAASIAFASAIISGEAPSFSKTLIALDSPFASPALKKCSPKVS